MESYDTKRNLEGVLIMIRELITEVKMLREVVQRHTSEHVQPTLDAATQRDAEAARRVRAILGSG